MTRIDWLLSILFAIVPAAAGISAPNNIAVDIDSRDALFGFPPAAVETKPGFTSWDVTGISASGAAKVVDGISLQLFGLSQVSSGSRYRTQTSGDVPGDVLQRDFVFSEGIPGAYIGLRVGGLEPGTYAMHTWHYDGFYFVLLDENFVEIEVRNQGESGGTKVADGLALGFTPAAFQFEITAPGQVKEIIIREDGPFRRSRLNGFTIASVPEPSTALLAVISMVGLRIRRYRDSTSKVGLNNRLVRV